MKSKDIAVVIAVGGISALLAFLLSTLMFPSAQRNLSAEVVDPISSEFKDQPDARYFNDKSVNPTQRIDTDGEGNQKPFNDQTAQ